MRAREIFPAAWLRGAVAGWRPRRLFARLPLALLCALFAVAIAFAVAACAAAPPASETDRAALDEGLRLYSEARFDEARAELLRSAASENSEVRSESFLYLNALEMELGRWDAARPWLEKYHAEITRQSVERAVAKIERRVGLAVIVGALIALGFFSWRKRRSTTPPRRANPVLYEGFLAEAEKFRATPIYAEIAELAAQPERGREARVLSLARQEALDKALAETMGGFAGQLRTDFPLLTAGDIKLCCLSLAGLSTFGRALCFGSTETNIVKQRKHKLKNKVEDFVFDFIFQVKSQEL